MTINLEAEDFWRRAVAAIATAELIANSDLEDSANRAYYSAFYAVSALLSLEGVTLKTHQAVESRVHLSLVKPGRWTVELGDKYKKLHRLRIVGDYGRLRPVSVEEVKEAIAAASDILNAVSREHPDFKMF